MNGIKRRHMQHLFLWVLHLLCLHVSFAQISNKATNSLAEQIHQFSNQQRSDLVYLQTNKDIYETEEDLWFKGYVLDAKHFTPSNKSKILFVQLLEDATNQPVWEEKYEIENGFVDGHLFLQDTLKPGNYTLAAYSAQSFFKEQEEFYAHRKIKVLKSIQHKISELLVKDTTLHFSLFPEGGHLVSGIRSRLAFKAVNANGLPLKVIGTLYENDTTLITFKSSHAGMGSLLFTPHSKKKYYIKLSQPATNKTYELPKIQSNGKTLQLIRTTKDKVSFKVSQTSSQKETIFLRVQVRGVVYNIFTAILDKEGLIMIPLKDIPQGIAEVTLFNEALEPVAERLVYLNNHKKLYIKPSLYRAEYETREKAILKIQVTDENNKPIRAHLGLSIYDRIYHNPMDTKNIQSHFYLSTQLKGNLYNPAYYFDKKNKDRKEALNLLLLTQGWRVYTWAANNLNERNFLKSSVINDQIKGHLFTNKKTKEPLTSKFIMVFTAHDKGKKDLVEVGASGFFNINTKHLKLGTGGYLYIKPMTPKKFKYNINLFNTSFKTINKYQQDKIHIYPLAKEQETTEDKEVLPFAVTEQRTQLDEVLVQGKNKRVFRDKYLGKLNSLANAHLNFDYVCEDNILNCKKVIHPNGNIPIEGEMYLTQSTKLSKFRVVVYHFIPLFTFSEEELLKNYNLVMLKGYYGEKEFYQPVYDNISVKDPFPDYRNTLFWKPDIITDKNGEATVEFFCSDLNTIFLGHLEGLSDGGLLGMENFEFAVRKLSQ